MVLFDQFCKINQEGLETKVMKEPSSLEIIQQDIKICKKCELCNTRNNAVPGIGDKNADVVFIGEAPGKNEDIHGEPFIGTAGKILDNALENAGLTRNNVYITNIVKCRPPNNRVPNDIEKSMCNDYLEEELEIINPKNNLSSWKHIILFNFGRERNFKKSWTNCIQK